MLSYSTQGLDEPTHFPEYLTERRAIAADPQGRRKTIFLDNCSGHLEESQCQNELNRLNARLHYLPVNATDLCQPADSFVIAKIKDVWSRVWNNKKIELIEDEQWQNKVRKDDSYLGKLKNPGKCFFLELAAAAVREANQKRDESGINYARKAMMRRGLSLSVDGTWSTTQLFPHLQEIIKRYPQEFAGKSQDVVVTSDADNGAHGQEAEGNGLEAQEKDGENAVETTVIEEAIVLERH
ncbi:hypothetical protein PC129_g22897 [Phytophthora cactorum]|uniref:DDE-1 domain-containing protein n=1 Tax=Phytophthora cactorum TaxID=29920 RepID=A0A329RSZ3_9STRA|nr:hypothetical protein Pcac1_g13250 [Phytophthora cactorum]KAG2794426.1 hypothetical protein PC111_g22602 [Phytophthora cactorum]KAG2795301.1 hypothetical protein PC112_g22693 [Phytophthora cactorum]KAG2815887.1 hypothetical protein PC113_g23158 [Phytophthora cactorum]KAG2886694.1 hypothetical protein PC117_g25326 [Phytophthora cactorum]